MQGVVLAGAGGFEPPNGGIKIKRRAQYFLRRILNFRGSFTHKQINRLQAGSERRLVHFVRFDNLHDEHFQFAVRAFGPPDYLHRVWDRRALREIDEGDLIVFAKGGADQSFATRNGDDEAYSPPLTLAEAYRLPLYYGRVG